MKFNIPQATFHQPLSLLSRYVSSRPALPVLSNILIEATQDSLVFSATNLDVTIKAHISAIVEEPGSTTVPARLLSEVIATLPSSTITVTTDDTQCHIQSGKTDS